MRGSMSSRECVAMYGIMLSMTSSEGESPFLSGYAEQVRLEIGGDWWNEQLL